jgi:hypothetical protein
VSKWFGSAEHLLRHLGVEKPGDIDLEAIAQYCQATVRYRQLDSCVARIVGSGSRAIISVNKGDILERRRFSIGHELGHWMHDRGNVGYACTASNLSARDWESADKEARANRFGAELLMPAYLFRSLADRKPMTLKSASELADVFKTSLTASARRLIDLGSFPAMLVCHGKLGRVWFTRGRDVPDFLYPRRDLHQDTEAFSILYGSSRPPSRPTPVTADLWIDHRAGGRYSLIEHSARTWEYVLSMLWWKDERMIVDLS